MNGKMKRIKLAQYADQGWGKYIDSVLGYKYKYINNV